MQDRTTTSPSPRRRRARAVAVALFALMSGVPGAAPAEPAQETVTMHLQAGTLAAGERALTELVTRDPADATARFGLGAVRFLAAVERLAQALYRHGLEAPRSSFVPILRLPVPANPNPQPLSYAAFRAILDRFAADLTAAEATLAAMPSAPFRLSLDLARLRLDLNGDGTAEEGERLWRLIGGVDPRLRGSGAAESFPVGFDAADASWLRGYCHLIAAVAEFWLAHDFQVAFEDTFQLFFPRAGLAAHPDFSAALADSRRRDMATIADAIAFLHLLSWPVAEPERLRRAYDHLAAVPALSRQSWAAILAETDDADEWIPNPRQTNRFATLPVTQDRVDAWLGVMDALEALLQGRKLVPHWRFDKGVDLRRLILDHKRFDPILWATGQGVTPFLTEGPVVSAEAWRQILRAFQGNFFGYAVWFN